MTFLGRPSCITDQRIVEEVLLCLLDEHLPGFSLQRRNTALLYGLRPRPKASKKLFYIQLSHQNLLRRPRLRLVRTTATQPRLRSR